ncbi:MAG: hypothetical protein EZS28_019081 [Streblomastix strix]|uniref:Uncharacterized protein n=1 Tax=Streblomastix strix TaxID=222440 RepID=A0A5J4VS27_9EUKA|nr:MAG: hypothetical protein EZS28_019081 [Streblomastix strix]
MEIEEELAETGTLANIPQNSTMQNHQQDIPLRFIDSEIMFGISPHPLQSENYQCKTLESWQINNTIALMDAENNDRQRWRIDEREKVRNQLNIQKQLDQQEKVNDQSTIQSKIGKIEEQIKNATKEIDNIDMKDSIQTTKLSTIDFQRDDNSIQKYLYHQFKGSKTQITTYQPVMTFLQDQITPRNNRMYEKLFQSSKASLDHPIQLHSIQGAILQERLLTLPKEFL